MRKLIAAIAVGVLVGGLLAGAGPASAATFNYLSGQGGTADPLQLAASGALIPFQTSVGASGIVALVEVAAPVNDKPDLHMIFFNRDCARRQSVGAPVTENGVVFVDPVVSNGVSAGTSGLVAIGRAADPFTLTPVRGGFHSRVYQFNPANGQSRIFEPIILDSYEFNSSRSGYNGGGSNPLSGWGTHVWSPLRTGATFYAPWETATVNTQLTFICPRTTIQGEADAVFGTYDPKVEVPAYTTLAPQGFPVIWPPFKATTTLLRAVVYGVGGDYDEVLINDIRFPCDCLTPDVPILTLGPGVYNDARLNPRGSYTEMEVVPVSATPVTNAGNSNNNDDGCCDEGFPRSAQVGSFTGYKASFTVGSPLNNFFGRLSSANGRSLNRGSGTTSQNFR